LYVVNEDYFNESIKKIKMTLKEFELLEIDINIKSSVSLDPSIAQLENIQRKLININNG